MINSLKESESIKESFGKYISEEVRDEILAGRVPLDGEMKRATLLFSDIRDFTPFVESTHPKQVVAMLSLETIGYYSNKKGSQSYPPPLSLFYPSTGNFIGFVGNLASGNLVRKIIT